MKVLIVITLMNLVLFIAAATVHHLETGSGVPGIAVQSRTTC